MCRIHGNVSLARSGHSVGPESAAWGTVYLSFLENRVLSPAYLKPRHLENYKGFVLNYSVGEPKLLVPAAFCLCCYSQPRGRKLANYSVYVGVCGVGEAVSGTQPGDWGAGR